MKLYFIHHEPQKYPIPFHYQKPHPRCHKDRNVTETSYHHRQIKTQTHQHDMYHFWHVVNRHCLPSPTSSRIYLSPHGRQGIMHHVVPLLHVVSWSYLTSPTHSRIYLFPLWAEGNDASHNTPLAFGLLAQWEAASATHSRIYPCHAKWEPPTWVVVIKIGNHAS